MGEGLNRFIIVTYIWSLCVCGGGMGVGRGDNKKV